MKKGFNIWAALAAGGFAIISSIMGDMNQKKAIDEAVRKNLESRKDDGEES